MGYESVANLPVEFYHYYHGSNTDMGTLIEVIHSNSYMDVHIIQTCLFLPRVLTFLIS